MLRCVIAPRTPEVARGENHPGKNRYHRCDDGGFHFGFPKVHAVPQSLAAMRFCLAAGLAGPLMPEPEFAQLAAGLVGRLMLESEFTQLAAGLAGRLMLEPEFAQAGLAGCLMLESEFAQLAAGLAGRLMLESEFARLQRHFIKAGR